MNTFACHLAAAAALAVCWTAAGGAEPRLAEDFESAPKGPNTTPDRWTFTNGAEFPGARGSFERAKEAAHGGQWGGRLSFDFTGGGAYVGAILALDKAPDIAAVRVWVRRPAGTMVTFRYTDQTGQTLQKHFRTADDKWFQAVVGMDGWTGHWGGANDGVVHGPPKLIAFLVGSIGAKKGEVLLDDVRLIEGKPGTGAGMETSQYVAAAFEPQEGWRSGAAGSAGGTKLDGRKWRFDFTKGASAVSIAPREFSLLGTPQEIRLRVRGSAAGHPVRLRLATHFMTFEKVVGELLKDGQNELVTESPPGEGWRWFGGENDGKLHGPLRITGIFLDKGDKADEGELELLDIRVRCTFPPAQACVLTADLRETSASRQFVATARSVSAGPLEAVLSWTIRDWSGKTIAQGRREVTIPAATAPLEANVPVPATDQPFLEAEFSLESPGQLVAAAQAYHVAAIQPNQDARLDPTSPFGMGLYLNRYPGDAKGLETMDRAARLAREAGVKWSREDFNWARVEYRKGEFDWKYYDALVATAKRNGISIYGLLAGWPGWTKPYTPEGLEDFCRFAEEAARHFRDDIEHWEVWNEPNIFFWQGPRDMYADLLKQAGAAIRKGNPKAKVLGCSTAGIDHKFIQRTMELGATFDILTIHPYRASLDDRAFIRDLQKAADLVKRPDGSLREVWITEMGWTTNVPHNTMNQDFQPTTQRRQAELIARCYVDAIASGVAPNISWYDFRNDGTDPINFEHNLGIVTRDFIPRPAYRAFATVTRMLQGKKVQKPLDLGADVVAYRFTDGEGRRPVAVLWSLEAERTVQLPAGKAATLTDLMGTSAPLTVADAKAAVTLQPLRPVFVTIEE
jgi:hypothetical protein